MKRLEPEVEREVRRLAAKGYKLREIGRILGCSRHAVTNTLRREPRPPSPTAWNPSPARAHTPEVIVQRRADEALSPRFGRREEERPP